MDNVKDGVTAGSEEDVHDRARWENSLIDSLKRHRLLFLCFAVAKRMDPATGTIETVTYPDPPSGEEIIFDDLQDDIDRVSQHSQDLNRFYNEAFDRFGSTAKASKDKAAEPRWQLAGSEGWELLEESAKIIRNWCCLILQAGSTPGERTLANEVIAAAFGEGQDVASDDDKLTWWPSKIVPWNYPAKLEELANRLAGVFVPSGSAEAPDSNTEVLASATIATPSAEPSYWNKLSKSMRAIVLLSDHEDWTDEQIARAVDRKSVV